MKNKIIYAFIILLLSIGCEDSFLDRDPVNDITTATLSFPAEYEKTVSGKSYCSHSQGFSVVKGIRAAGRQL